jgi:type IV secretion system protein VirD4
VLTPGEIMQLPPQDELVLVSGCAPIRASKARYFEDPRLSARILPTPPRPAGQAATSFAAWNQVIASRPAVATAAAAKDDDEDGGRQIERSLDELDRGAKPEIGTDTAGEAQTSPPEPDPRMDPGIWT